MHNLSNVSLFELVVHELYRELKSRAEVMKQCEDPAPRGPPLCGVGCQLLPGI